MIHAENRRSAVRKIRGVAYALTHDPISLRLLISLCEFSLAQGIEAIIGFFDRPMMRVYQRIGWTPSIIARSNIEGKSVVGRWNVSPLALESMRSRLHLSANDGRSSWSNEGPPLNIG